MAGSTAARQRVERICASNADARAVRLELLAELRHAIGFDAYAWVLTDPETRVLGRSLLWRELLCDYDVTDVASVVFRDGFGCWAFLELWRTARRAFDR